MGKIHIWKCFLSHTCSHPTNFSLCLFDFLFFHLQNQVKQTNVDGISYANVEKKKKQKITKQNAHFSKFLLQKIPKSHLTFTIHPRVC